MDIENQKKWLEFSKSAWDAAGHPEGLDPDTLLKSPKEFDRSYYNYFERRYMDMWLSFYSRVNPADGKSFILDSDSYKEAWQRNFDWNTIWKQTLPLFVYGTTLRAKNEALVDLASWYCLGQAIPSMVIDRILDDNAKDEHNNSDSVFCMLSYVKALKGIRSMKLPNSSKFEDVYFDLTGEMYEKMFTEYNSRFKPIPEFCSEAITNYLLPGGRLLSSVFFGILPVWAYSLVNKKPSEKIQNSLKKLRMVRQLNDEILDVKEDLGHGLLTLPWLYAMEEKFDLRESIELLWEKRDQSSLDACFRILELSSGRERAMKKSLELLAGSMNETMECFSADEAFEVTLLHNVRWALLNWLEKDKFERNPDDIYQIRFPQDIILDPRHPIEPVPGSGVIVFNSTGKLLMTLVLKRGMLRWELPAGVALPDESLEETAKRETLEETGKNVEIGEMIASCWHVSKILNKGWMGLFFIGEISLGAEGDPGKIVVATPEAFRQNRFNTLHDSELYRSVNLIDCDFEELRSLCDCGSSSTVFESVVACGFVDWKKIPDGRIHPLHKELLEALETNKLSMKFLLADADKDFSQYDNESKLYFKN